MSESTNKPNALFWVIGIIALIWNLMGVIAYVTRALMTEDMIAMLPKEQQTEFLVEYPAWYTAAFAIAVFAGVLGCIALLLRKKFASTLFILSLIAVFVQFGYILLIQDFMEISGVRLIMPLLIILVAIFLA